MVILTRTSQLPNYPLQFIVDSRRLRIIGRKHLFYLGALPALGTFVVTAVYGNPSPFLIWLGGIAAIGVYLGTTMSYTPRPQSWKWAALFVVDGPLFVVAAQLRGGDGSIVPFAAEGFLMGGLFAAMTEPIAAWIRGWIL